MIHNTNVDQGKCLAQQVKVNTWTHLIIKVVVLRDQLTTRDITSYVFSMYWANRLSSFRGVEGMKYTKITRQKRSARWRTTPRICLFHWQNHLHREIVQRISDFCFLLKEGEGKKSKTWNSNRNDTWQVIQIFWGFDIVVYCDEIWDIWRQLQKLYAQRLNFHLESHSRSVLHWTWLHKQNFICEEYSF
jgi:hypothetical protein